MGLCVSCFTDDNSAHDYTCKGCKKRIGRDQTICLLSAEDEDLIFCSETCRLNFKS